MTVSAEHACEVQFDTTPVFIWLYHDNVMLYPTEKRSYTCRGGLYYCRGLNSSIIVPTMGGKRRWPPARHPVIPTHKRRPGALRHNQGLSDFHDMTDYWHFTHYSARNIDNNSDDNEDDHWSAFKEVGFNKGQKTIMNWETKWHLLDLKIHFRAMAHQKLVMESPDLCHVYLRVIDVRKGEITSDAFVLH